MSAHAYYNGLAIPRRPLVRKSGEIPVEAAIRVRGRVYTGDGHADAIRNAASEAAGRDDEATVDAIMDMDFDDGFITTAGRFVSREEAYDLAVENAGYDGPGAGWFDSNDLASLRRRKSAGRKAFRGLSRIESRVATMEATMDQLAESVGYATRDGDASRGELNRLQRSVSKIAADAEAIAGEVEQARATLVMLDDAGVDDAADDDRALEALGERIEAVQRQASDAADGIGAALDDIEEMA